MSDTAPLKPPSRREAEAEPQDHWLLSLREIQRALMFLALEKQQWQINKWSQCVWTTPPASRGRYRLPPSSSRGWGFLLTRTSFVVVLKLWLMFYIFLCPVFLPFLPPIHFSESLWVAIYLSTHLGEIYRMLPPGQSSRLFSDFLRPRHTCSGSSNSHTSHILQFTHIPY